MKLPGYRARRVRTLDLVHAGFFAPGINTLGRGWFRFFLGGKVVRAIEIHADDWVREESTEGEGAVRWWIPSLSTRGPISYDGLDIVLIGDSEPAKSVNGGRPVKIWQSQDQMNIPKQGNWAPGSWVRFLSLAG